MWPAVEATWLSCQSSRVRRAPTCRVETLCDMTSSLATAEDRSSTGGKTVGTLLGRNSENGRSACRNAHKVIANVTQYALLINSASTSPTSRPLIWLNPVAGAWSTLVLSFDMIFPAYPMKHVALRTRVKQSSCHPIKVNVCAVDSVQFCFGRECKPIEAYWKRASALALVLDPSWV